VQKELTRTLLDPLPYPTRREAAEQSTRPVHSIQAAIEEATIHSTHLLDPSSHRGSSRSVYSPLLLDPLLDPFTRPKATNSTRLVDLSKHLRILLIPHSEHLLDQLITRSMDTKAQTLQHPLLDPQDRALAQTASSLLSSSESRVFNILL